jgi:hypothetical protein
MSQRNQAAAVVVEDLIQGNHEWRNIQVCKIFERFQKKFAPSSSAAVRYPIPSSSSSAVAPCALPSLLHISAISILAIALPLLRSLHARRARQSLNPKPYITSTLNPRPLTLPFTLNPKPLTLYPKP